MIRSRGPLLTLILLLAAVPARGETLVFDLSLGALRIGTLKLARQSSADGYAARLTLRSTGLADLVGAVRFDARAEGGPGPQPRLYEESADTGRRRSQVRIDWTDGRPQVTLYAAEPAETVPPASETAGALDPVSALVAALAETAPQEACGLALRVFDGQRLAQVSLTRRQDSSGGLICTGEFTRLQGYRAQDLAERDRFPLRLDYTALPSGRMAVTGAEVQTIYGKVRLKRR